MCAVRVVSEFKRLVELDENQAIEIGRTIPIPQFSERIISEICKNVLPILKKRPTLLEINGPIIIVGDIHGNLIDLLRIFRRHGCPPQHKYLFVGDYVDRGSFSIESTLLLFALQILYPEEMYILRGNHEFREINQYYGFYDEIKATYGGDMVFNLVNDVFDYLPLAAILNKDLICIHGGIGPSLNSLDQIRNLHRPITDFENQVVASMMWADPDRICQEFTPSPRGCSYLFGRNVFEQFMEATSMRKMIRGHECIQKGIEYAFRKKVITVFSSSCYCNGHNRAGALVIDEDGNILHSFFDPIPQPNRNSIYFYLNQFDKATQNKSSLQIMCVQRQMIAKNHFHQGMLRRSCIKPFVSIPNIA